MQQLAAAGNSQALARLHTPVRAKCYTPCGLVCKTPAMRRGGPCRYRDPATQQEQTYASSSQQVVQHQAERQVVQDKDGRLPVAFRGKAVVVGAGPAGVTSAMFLASAGYQVDVLERRGHPSEMEVDKKRTYLIGLGERGLASLDKLGISVGPGVGRPMQGSVYAYKSGRRIEDPFTADTRIIGVDRQGLTAFLIDEAVRRFPESITFHFGVKPDLDLGQRRVRFVSKGSNQRSGSPLEVPYDLLVGADGAGSSVRAALEQEAAADVKVTRLTSPVAAMEYKAFTGLPWNDAIRAMLPADARGPEAGMTFFALNNPQPGKPSPGSIMLYCLRDWAGTMYLPEGTYGQLGEADHESAIRQFTPDSFPQEWIPLMAQQMAQAPPNRISPMYLVSHLAAPQLGVVLLGDAGHSVTPQMGQGCNSALEDCAMLAQALEGAGYDVRAGLAAFEARRAPQVHALQHMEEENAWVRRPPQWGKDPLDKSLARLAWLSFFMLLPLLRVVPGMKAVVHASLFQNIMSSTMPYDALHRAVRVAPLVWVGLLAAVVAGARAVLAAVFA